MTTTEIKTNDRTATEATTVRPNTTTTATTSRLNFAKAAPKAFRAVIGLDAAAREGLDPALVELVQIRASHLNRCAYCLHMHTTDARKAGESEERLHMVAVWQEADHFFTDREQSALALTDAVTRIGDAGVPDEVYDRAATHFPEEELAHLLALIFTINTWNRIALSTAKRAGTDER
ncbi:carboxymuconolactone decarboxylase family protein [Streptomyces sp. PTY087I2]|uniref:carboxymuconolactone decarboxylase family protein n=1 Tax=Streptomyces sp. PTY087I2 TaxID=1819298 RepID=UPI00080B3F64|nr:carboxymuconolactone decarboxylase family protein [Streptomyces sp. PTY087I2]OCC07652.1 Carboxymuconolactone decarboxylase family protein [Streptomyces sp. PTY087I2]